ncbi:MAG TPA: hypothetical protein VJZ71_02170 [Phycisphaerae bacterium]|nr:hypothetical protein [Phycisphaerae bacterium]
MQYFLILVLATAGFIGGCDRSPNDGPAEQRDTIPAAGSSGAAITNRVDVPDAVRKNLGITFARVESRAVARTLRVPGKFEFLPDARREYRTMLSGRVELLVGQFQRVDLGTPMYRLDSPPWRELQQKLAEAEAQIRESEKRVEMMGPLREAHEQHHRSIERQVDILTTRAAQLAKGSETGSISAAALAQAQVSLAEANIKLAETKEKEAELNVMRVEVQARLDTARTRFNLLLESAATLLDVPKSRLLQPNGDGDTSAPMWRTREHVEVAAGAPGYVDSITLTNGAWADATSLVLTTVQPERIRFHAHGMQSDLQQLSEGLPARVVPPRGGSIALQDTMEGKLMLGISADPQQRTMDLYVTPTSLSNWARPGVTAYLEVTLAGSTEELAIPTGAVIQDGLSKIIFRRDPKDPNKVIRMEPDLGVSDDRWVAVLSGLGEGDEVVLDGIYQLMLATSAGSPKGGHFHPDGTFHEGNE